MRGDIDCFGILFTLAETAASCPNSSVTETLSMLDDDFSILMSPVWAFLLHSQIGNPSFRHNEVPHDDRDDVVGVGGGELCDDR